jgi:orotidine-5'-phosphate decarboxylase
MTTVRNFIEMIKAQNAIGKYVCVGFDPDMDHIPQNIIGTQKDPVKALNVFAKFIIEQTAPEAACFKPNLAFFEAIRGGEEALHYFVEYAHKYAPEVPIIGDGKNTDIGNTNKFYAKKMFERYGFDAATGNPYMGGPGDVMPLLENPDKCFIPVLLTSNSDGGMIQKLRTENGHKTDYVFESVARHLKLEWNAINNNVGVVVGATKSSEDIESALALTEGMFTLIPGIGAQGGDLKTLLLLMKKYPRPFVINSTRDIIYQKFPGNRAFALNAEIKNLYNLL